MKIYKNKVLLRMFAKKDKTKRAPTKPKLFCYGDPSENRTRVTAVKGPCLNLLTNGPDALKQKAITHGSGSRIRTNDQSGMNRVL